MPEPWPWGEAADQVIGGDHVIGLAYLTPAKGVVILPVDNFALRNRAAGTITAVNSSVGAWRKLERIRRDPRVALVYHSRAHAESNRPEYVLVQGRAHLTAPIADYPTVLGERWDRFEPWSETGAIWKRWLRIYALRVEIEVEVERVVVWPDLGCGGVPVVHGAPLPPDPPPPQTRPGKGTGPRIDPARAAAKAMRLPSVLLGWAGSDGYPMAVPVGILSGDAKGVELGAAPRLVPLGGRRAGLTAHRFSRSAIGQIQRKHTGWLQASPDGSLLYAPHAQSNYRFPASRTLYRVFSGGATRWGVRGARRAGLLDPPQP